MMFRVYTSTFVLICVVTQALTDLPEGFCQREIRNHKKITKLSSTRCTRKSLYCPTTGCFYQIKYYKCSYLQYLQVAKVKLINACCDGYYSRNGRCEKEAVNATPGTTCNTCLCNDTCTNDTTSVTDKLPVPTEANRDEDTNWNTSAYNEAGEKKTTTSIDFSSTHPEGNNTEGESRNTSMIVAVLSAVVLLTIVAVIICWKVRHHRKPKNQSLEEIEPQPPQNNPWDQNASHEIEDIELRDESGIYFSLEPRGDQSAYENIDDEFPHDANGTRNPYDTVDRRNRYSTEADPREDVNGQGVPDSKDESDIYHHLNRNRKETYHTDVYGILSGVELSQIQL